MDAFRLANTALATDIFKILNEKSKTENFIFSPLCISSTLALAFKGANGNTAAEIEKVLHVENVNDCDFRFQTLNSDISRISAASSLKMVKRVMWTVASTALSKNINLTKKPYASELEIIDIKSRAEEARKQINNSVKDLTDGNMENVLAEGLLNENTNMILLGASYYKGKWLYKFNESETKECDFYVTKTETKPVQMMQLEARLGVRRINEENLVVLDIPFASKLMSMLIMMPNSIEDDSTGLEKLEKELTSDNYINWTNPSMMANSKVKLSLPKFKITSSLNLKEKLKSMGMNDAFNEEVADFSKMSEKKGLSVSEAIYENSIDIGEDGTETVDAIRERVLMSKTECKADHPFLFAIKHTKTQGILLCGRYTGPAASS
ncbi:LOW QUALITY PROTEIN: serpin B5 [Bufo bufo]|uniref:LOW QUALITY PROTEIN: serpin B5 n=1 Tax=Bufo bufo TaxID=8384 RepID=UPI001ABDBC1A|nr:LOW QUALITY PROTEIN: serpin B5 [Bufo bufo]